jgi:Fur family ferric uptake transcriptional regulator
MKGRGLLLAEVEERVAERLPAAVRFTPGRRLVVRALARGEGPVSAGELYEEVRRQVPLSSLYRTLTVLADVGVLERHHDADGLARFELGEWLLGHHHHLVCVECGRVQDVEVDDGVEDRVAQIASGIAAGGGYTVTGHRVDVEGVCEPCRV